MSDKFDGAALPAMGIARHSDPVVRSDPSAESSITGTSAVRSADDEVTVGVSSPEVAASGLATGETVSRYVVLQEVGHGAMGRVLRAYDPKLQREVALKEVRGNALDGEAKARLVAEARAMAKLSHPNVVGVFDVEELPTGALVLVMEYVDGRTLGAWLAEQPQPWREVVARFTAAGRGLAAAHEADLLHRDFKPANVLVTHDATKVTDFGLAKPAGAEPLSGEGSLVSDGSRDDLTEMGVVIGTPRYMAPEQHAGAELGPAADQYAFCVSLWETLCGEPPFGGPDLVLDKQQGPPRWPQSATPRPIVDAIMRGLSPYPEDRWPTLPALLEALGWDPARRRNRTLAVIGGTGVAVLGGVAVSAWTQARAERCSGASQHLVGVWDPTRSAEVEAAFLGIERPYAQHTWERTKAELDAYAEAWTTMHTDACVATAVRAEQSTQMLDLRMACLSRAAQGLLATVDTLADVDDEVLQRASNLTAGLPRLSRCADPEALAADVEPPAPEDAATVSKVRGLLAQSKAQWTAGRFEPALRSAKEAEALLDTIDYGPARTESLLHEGYALDGLGRWEEAESTLAEAIEVGARYRQWPVVMSAAIRLAFVVGNEQQRVEEGLRYAGLARGIAHGDPIEEALVFSVMSNVLSVKADFDGAAEAAREAIARQERILGPMDSAVSDSRNSLARALHGQGKYPEAEAELRTTLAIDLHNYGTIHPNVAISRGNLGVMLAEQGKFEQAEEEFRASLDIREQTLDPGHPDLAGAYHNLSMILGRQERWDEALPVARAALDLRVQGLGAEHAETAQCRMNLGNVLQMMERRDEAEIQYRTALAVFEKTLGPEHPSVSAVLGNLGIVAKYRGQLEEAEALMVRALEIDRKAFGDEHPEVAKGLANLASIQLERGRLEDGQTHLRAALEMKRKTLGEDHPSVTETSIDLATVLLTRKQTEEALQLAEHGWARDRSLTETRLREFASDPTADPDTARRVTGWLEEKEAAP